MWQISVPKDNQAEYADLCIFNANFGRENVWNFEIQTG